MNMASAAEMKFLRIQFCPGFKVSVKRLSNGLRSKSFCASLVDVFKMVSTTSWTDLYSPKYW